MTAKRSSIVFYLSLILIPIGMYSKTWLPGNLTIMGSKEPFFILGIGFLIIMFYINFEQFLKLKIHFPNLENKIILLLTFLVWSSIILYNTQEISKAKNIAFLLSYSILIIVFFYIFPRFLFQNESYFEKFILIISNCGFLFAFIGLFFFFFGLSPVPQYSFSVISFINHPNNTSIVFTTTIIPTLFYIYWKWKVFTLAQKIFYISSLLIQLAAQLYTYTRAGLIACAIGMMLFWALYYRGRFIFILPVFVVFIPIFGAAFFQAKGFASFISRFYLLIPAYQMITSSTQRALWGYGITDGLEEYKKTLVSIQPSEFLINDPHNTYVTLILMLGVVFTAMLLLFIFIMIIKSFKKVFTARIKFEGLFYIFIITTLISLLIQGLFDAELIKADFFTIQYLLIIIGLMYCTLALKKNPNVFNRPGVSVL